MCGTTALMRMLSLANSVASALVKLSMAELLSAAGTTVKCGCRPARPDTLMIWPADSSSEGNTRAVSSMFRVGRFVQQGVENLVGRCVVVALARPWVEVRSDPVKVRLGELRQVGALRELLPQQAVDVLVGAALPWGVGIGKVDPDPGGDGQLPVPGHLLALVVGHCQAERRGDAQHAFDESVPRGRGFGIRQFD